MRQLANEFRIFAHGVAFDPDKFLTTTSLTFDGVWRKGESGKNHPKSSGVFKILGDGLELPLFEQERIAIGYLENNRTALKALASYPGVTAFILGLQYRLELDPGMVGFTVGASPRLLSHTIDVGLETIFYVMFDRTRKRAPRSRTNREGSRSRR